MPKARPVYVEYTKGERKGERFVVASAARAKELHPDATIMHYEDTPGEKYEEPKAATKADKQKDEGS